MVNRVVVGAGYGLRDWLVQRMTAVIMLLYTFFFLTALALTHPGDHASWKALFSHTWMRIPTLLFFLSMCLHLWVGVRDILMDYVKLTGLRLAFQVLVIVLLAAYFAWAVQILWRA